MPIVWDNVLVGILFTIVAGIMGIGFLMIAVWFMPRLVNKLTPNIDEEKEIVRGNMAVAHYFGAVVQAILLGLSIIIAAAVIAGLHG